MLLFKVSITKVFIEVNFESWITLDFIVDKAQLKILVLLTVHSLRMIHFSQQHYL